MAEETVNAFNYENWVSKGIKNILTTEDNEEDVDKLFFKYEDGELFVGTCSDENEETLVDTGDNSDDEGTIEGDTN